jgi:hypothetical protein
MRTELFLVLYPPLSSVAALDFSFQSSPHISTILLQINFRCCAAPTFSAQMWEWYDELSKILNFWYPDGRAAISFDPQLWTIPLEMSNSIVLFAVLIALARCKVVLRMILLVSTMLICMRVGQWVASEFLMGMFFAELVLIQEDLNQYFTSSETIALVVCAEEAMSLLSEEDGEEKEEGNEPTHHQYQIRRRQLQEVKRIGSIVLKVFCIINLIFALWLAGWPEEHPEQDAGFNWIMRHTGPPYNNAFDRMQFPWLALVAFQIVFASQQVPFLQSFLTTPVIRYLGKISYSMYLMHWSVLECLLLRIFPHIWRFVQSILGDDGVGSWGVTLVWPLSVLALTPAVVWSGDLFCTFVDDNCVAFAKWLEGKCIKREGVYL